jgi:hypothetical protein
MKGTIVIFKFCGDLQREKKGLHLVHIRMVKTEGADCVFKLVAVSSRARAISTRVFYT